MPMQTLREYPPNYEDICKAIPHIKDAFGIVFTYWPNVYYPDGDSLAQHVACHESVHLNQQKQMGVEKWWTEYLKNPEFRFQQELQAYRAQFKYIQRARNWRYTEELLRSIAHDLSGPMYGGLLDYQEARQAISKK